MALKDISLLFGRRFLLITSGYGNGNVPGNIVFLMGQQDQLPMLNTKMRVALLVDVYLIKPTKTETGLNYEKNSFNLNNWMCLDAVNGRICPTNYTESIQC